MKITVYNSKGGVGKTRISINLALMLDCAIITNDENTLTLESVFDENHYMKLKRDQPLEILPDDYNIVFDFGGFADPRVKTAIAQSNWVIVPTLPENDEIQATLNIISEIEKLNNTIERLEKEENPNQEKIIQLKKIRSLLIKQSGYNKSDKKWKEVTTRKVYNKITNMYETYTDNIII